MLEALLSADTSLFLTLNSIHSETADFIMYWVSHKYFWIPFYAFLVALLFKHYTAKQAATFCLLLIITFALTNTLSVEAFKKVFERPRPCHNELIQAQVHLVHNHCGGAWGFVSSHASNVFGLAMCVFLCLGKKIKWIGFLLFAWASLVSYSRIYLGVHYPLDIVCGALLGILVAKLVFFTSKNLLKLNAFEPTS